MQFWTRHQHKAASDAPEHTEADVQRAYEKGRRDERVRHHRHPLIGLAVFAISAVGAATLYLAATQGSFTRGGEVVDHKLASAATKVELASQDATAAVTGADASTTSAASQADQTAAQR